MHPERAYYILFQVGEVDTGGVKLFFLNNTDGKGILI